MASIAVSGQLLRHPAPANVMAGLHYLLGLRLLGHDVLYVEERGWLSRSCEDEGRRGTGVPGGSLEMVRGILNRLGIDIPVVWADSRRGLVEGLLWSQLRERLAATDLLLEIGEPCGLEERSLPARRAFIDIEPVVSRLSGFADHGYDAHFSYGVNVRRLGSGPIGAAVDWLPTVPPIVPRLWRVPRPRPDAPIRTFATTAPVGALEHGGVWLDDTGGDCQALRALPAYVDGSFELALPSGAEAVRDAFADGGWKVRPLGQVAGSITAYHGFLTGARAEVATAREPNVAAQNGWLGDRTACSLAAGRPAIVPDTGIGEWLSTGSGLLTFDDAAQAAECVERVTANPGRHARAARALADEVFHFGVVLTHLLERSLPRRVDAVA